MRAADPWCGSSCFLIGGERSAPPRAPAPHFDYGGPVKKNLLGLAFLGFVFLAGSGWAQTFEINGQSSPQAQKPQQGKKGKNNAAAPSKGRKGSGAQSSGGQTC